MSPLKLNPAELQANLLAIDQKPAESKPVAEKPSVEPAPPKKPSASVTSTRMSATERFVLLSRGDWQSARNHKGEPYPSQSEADEAFCSIVARQCNGDPVKIAALLGKSGLNRDKWNREDYRERTIAAALKGFKPEAEPVDVCSLFRGMRDAKQTTIEPLIENLFTKGSILGIGGYAGWGKSLMEMSIARGLIFQLPVFGIERFRPVDKFRVVYVNPEITEGECVQRARMFGLPEDPEIFSYHTMDMGPLPAFDSEEMMEFLKGKILLLDPLIGLTTAEEENSPTQNRKFTKTLYQPLGSGCLGIIISAHGRKIGADEDITLENSFRGTGDIAANLGTGIGIRMMDPATVRIQVKCVKPRNIVDFGRFEIQGRTEDSSSIIEQTKDFKLAAAPGSTISIVDGGGSFEENEEYQAAVPLFEQKLTTKEIKKKLGIGATKIVSFRKHWKNAQPEKLPF